MLKVKHYLTSCEICKKLDVSPNADTNINYIIILDEIDRAKNKFITSKMVKLKKYKHKKSFWITKGLLKSIRYRDKLYKQLKLTNPDTFEYSVLKINLKSYNAILKRSFRIAKQVYFESCFNKFQSDIKNTWKTINEILCKDKTKKTLPKYFKEAESIIVDEVDIANKFNTFFTEIGINLASNIKYQGHFDHSHYLLKIIEPAITKPLTILTNQVLCTGMFPDKLKIAKVIPIHKKGDATVFNNYRPISLLPTISRVLEKIIYDQVSCYLNDSKLLFNNQYGFRSMHSTEYAALELIDRIITQMDKDELPINIYIDLSKAFDTIYHSILINKL